MHYKRLSRAFAIFPLEASFEEILLNYRKSYNPTLVRAIFYSLGVRAMKMMIQLVVGTVLSTIARRMVKEGKTMRAVILIVAYIGISYAW